MTEQTNTAQEKAPPSLEEIKATYDQASSTNKTLMRATLTLSAIIDSKLDRQIKIDAMLATMKSFAADIELGAYERVMETAERKKLPPEVVMALTAVSLCGTADKLRAQVANHILLFQDECEQALKAKGEAEKQPEPVPA
ncbi:hypothetical protein [Bradyrhizobium sp. sGM-13]|uniref:hypothetical protein n=1 Tax=Bradyrhizobium sp. sGM-13 TaxID=2831781 RepID=UPI001BCB0182|nr:hypothetical protein [Bradyrhizobium sp. sGM-13]